MDNGEVAWGMSYRLLWQGLLSRGLPSTSDAGIAFERTIQITHDKPDQYSRLLQPSLWAAKNPCRLSGRKKPLPPIK